MTFKISSIVKESLEDVTFIFFYCFIDTNCCGLSKKKKKNPQRSRLSAERRAANCIEFPYRLLAVSPKAPSIFILGGNLGATCRYSFTLFPSFPRETIFLRSLAGHFQPPAPDRRRFEKVRTIGIVSSFTPWKDSHGLDALETPVNKGSGDIFCPRERTNPTITTIDTIFSLRSLKCFIFIFLLLFSAVLLNSSFCLSLFRIFFSYRVDCCEADADDRHLTC